MKPIESSYSWAKELARAVLYAFVVGCLINMCTGCIWPGDFDYKFDLVADSGTDSGSLPDSSTAPDTGAPETPDASPDPPDAAPIVDAGADTGASAPDASTPSPAGSWVIQRSSPPIRCSTFATATGDYNDSWRISISDGLTMVSVIASEWPISSYSGDWDGVTLTLHGTGAGTVDGIHQSVTSDFTLTLENGKLVGSESSEANGCNEPRTVGGIHGI